MLRTYTPEEKYHSNYRWLMLALSAFTPMLVLAMPMMSLPVLFPEIKADLNLTLIEQGWIWAVSSITGMFVGLIGGTLGDRFGARRTLIALCLLTGVTGALRGYAINFPTFIITSFLLGLVQPAIAVNVFKIAGEWFRPQQLGMASGVISAGFAMGLSLGALVSASVLSPLLGSWRGVFFFYGVLAILIAILWQVLHPRDTGDMRKRFVPLREGLPHVMRLRRIWMVGLGGMGIHACVQGANGYLPTYLRSIGWNATTADNALATFYFVSLLGAIPISMLSDKLGVRKGFLMTAALMITVGTGLLAVVEGNLVWLAVLIGGMMFDAFMGIQMATIMEVKGVGVAYIGTALGFAGVIRQFGGAFSPPLGNSLEVYGRHLPFVFWAAMGLFGLIVFSLMRSDTKQKVEEIL